MHFEVLSTKYANINHFRLFFWKFCYKISLFWAFFLEFFGLGNNLALKAPHYTRTTTLILCITFHFWVRMRFFENAGGFAGTPSLAVGLFYTCILQGARQVQGPCCTNPNFNICGNLLTMPSTVSLASIGVKFLCQYGLDFLKMSCKVG